MTLRHVWIFLAQAGAHVLWYLDVRAVQGHRLMTVLCMDQLYMLLGLYAATHVVGRETPRGHIVAYLLGGAVGTAIGMSLPV